MLQAASPQLFPRKESGGASRSPGKTSSAKLNSFLPCPAADYLSIVLLMGARASTTDWKRATGGPWPGSSLGLWQSAYSSSGLTGFSSPPTPPPHSASPGLSAPNSITQILARAASKLSCIRSASFASSVASSTTAVRNGLLRRLAVTLQY